MGGWKSRIRIAYRNQRERERERGGRVIKRKSRESETILIDKVTLMFVYLEQTRHFAAIGIGDTIIKDNIGHLNEPRLVLYYSYRRTFFMYLAVIFNAQSLQL